MIHVVVNIQVKNFDALEKFEHEAAKLMLEHNGKIISAFEVIRNSDGSGEEIHLLEFQSREHFLRYKADAKHQLLAELRSQAITAIEVKISTRLKSYH